ncbi:DNA mismatch repair protein Mlh3-like isoform X2 [Acropora muricata]|uniref:DNA mismatch repair protein Mlh3-like isoform X2 n=1 Tax=Acropora muricata TaxID=159855 RepID=UPI0034E3954F
MRQFKSSEHLMSCEQRQRTIRPLQEDVRSNLRSGVAITNLTHCVEELVLNSLDADSTSITVRIDVPNYKIQVSDNGNGIVFEDLKHVGERYMTSKCHALKDLENLNFFGFRGEALASISKICDVLEISTRYRSSYQTYCKLFQNSQVLDLGESTFPRTSSGTTVTVHNIFANLPVRQNLITETYDLDRVRHRIASMALVNPKTSFLLINDSTGAKCLQTRVCKSSVSTFSQLFGNSRSKGLQKVQFEHKKFKVSGYISTEFHHSKTLQFLFVNQRLLLKTKIHKLVNSLLEKSEFMRNLIPCDKSELGPDLFQGKVISPQNIKTNDKHGIFFLNIICPVTDYDICLDPVKTLIEFQDWDDVLYCMQRCVEDFCNKNNLVLQHENSPKSTGSERDENDGFAEVCLHPCLDVFAYKREIETGNVKRSLHSSTVFRKTSVGIADNKSLKMTSNHEEKSHLSDQKQKENIIQNDIAGNEVFSGLGVYKDQSEFSPKSVSKETLPSLKNSTCCLNVTNMEKSLECSFVRNHRNDEKADPGIITSSSTIFSASESTKGCENYSAKVGDAQVRTSMLQGLSNQRNTDHDGRPVIVGTNAKEMRSKHLTTFTSPCPITLQPGYARKRPWINKGTSSASCEVVSKDRRLISLKGSVKRRNRANRVHMQESCDFDNREGNACMVACCNQTEETPGCSTFTVQEMTPGVSKESISTDGKDTNPVGQRGACHTTALLDCDQQCTNAYADRTSLSNSNKLKSPNRETETFCGVTENTEHWQGRNTKHESNQSSALSETTRETSVEEKTFDKQESNSCMRSNWHCTFDPSLGRNLFLNIRTGHSSYEHPSRLSVASEDCSCVNENDEVDNKQHQNVPHPVASHLSFSCTPWLPRQHRRSQISSFDEDTGSFCSNGESEVAMLYQEHQYSQETEEELCKWASADKLKAYKQNLWDSTGSTVAEMLDNWRNPVFTAPEKDILMVNKPGNCVRNQIPIHNMVQPHRFTRDMLESMRVLQQLDEKFIVGVVSYRGNDDDLLVLIDQHAAHERVRLEQLQSELFENISTGSRPRIKSSPVSPPMEIFLFAEEIRHLKTFQSEIERIGIHFTINESVEESDEVSVFIQAVPSVFVEREVSEVKRGRQSVTASKVKELIREHLENLTMRGTPAIIPKNIFQVISSQACHGAVKFGEPLGVNECQQLVMNLSKCHLPFQCAHGRPSVIPLADLWILGRKMVSQDIERRPRLDKLHYVINKKL